MSCIICYTNNLIVMIIYYENKNFFFKRNAVKITNRYCCFYFLTNIYLIYIFNG